MLSIRHHETRLPQISTGVLRGIDTDSQITGFNRWLDSRLYGTKKKKIILAAFHTTQVIYQIAYKLSNLSTFLHLGQFNNNSVHCVSGSYP